MQIPLFPLPSNPAKEITFNMPTVADAMNLTSSDARYEERVTTRYLNELQPKDKFSDSAEWTAQDRRTALWWIFTNSRIDTMLTSSYACEHCGNTHFVDVDMRKLELIGIVLLEHASEEHGCDVNGIHYPFRLTNLNGHAMMHLEEARTMLPPEDAPNFREEWINLRVMEVAHQLRLPDDPPDYLEATQRRYELLKAMALETEFQPLVASLQLYNRKNQHGLAIVINKGVTSLVLPPTRCKNWDKEGEAPLTPLLMPFRVNNFLPAFRSEWLGFTDE